MYKTLMFFRTERKPKFQTRNDICGTVNGKEALDR